MVRSKEHGPDLRHLGTAFRTPCLADLGSAFRTSDVSTRSEGAQLLRVEVVHAHHAAQLASRWRSSRRRDGDRGRDMSRRRNRCLVRPLRTREVRIDRSLHVHAIASQELFCRLHRYSKHLDYLSAILARHHYKNTKIRTKPRIKKGRGAHSTRHCRYLLLCRLS
jgi:hypothetical protein